MALVLPDTLTIEPHQAAVTNSITRESLGRRPATAITMRGQLELVRAARGMDDGDGTLTVRRAEYEVVLDAVLCAAVSYTPKHGDRVVSVRHALTGVTEAVNLYLGEPKPDGAGRLIRSTCISKEPARVAAATTAS